MRSIIFDTETTGLPIKGGTLDRQPRIIELGAIYIDHDGSIIRTLSRLLFTEAEIHKKAFKVHGITKEMLVGKYTFEEFLPDLVEFFQGADTLIAHNIEFDSKMLLNELGRVLQGDTYYVSCPNGFPWPKQNLCTVNEYQHVFGADYPKLEELYEKIVGKPLEQTHRALDDCMALHEILVKDDFFGKVSDVSN